MMKRLFQILMLIPALVGITSCNKVLDTKPTDFLTPVNYYQTETQITSALAGVYDVLGHPYWYGDRFLANLSIGNDEGYYFSSSVKGPESYTTTPDDANVTNLYNYLYQGVNRANVLLESLDKASISDDLRRHTRGETLFLRSFFLFTLTQWWGAVPMPLKSTSAYSDGQIPQTPAKQVYEQVIADMTEAESLLQDQTSTSLGYSGKISKTVVEGILARVCLFAAGAPFNDASKYALALKWAKKVKDSGEHSLNPSYSQIFINEAQDIYDVKESMWEVEFYGNRLGAYASILETGKVGVRNGIRQDNADLGFCQSYNWAYARLYYAYDVKDIRRDWNVAPYYFSGNNTSTKVNWTSAQIYNRYAGKWRREYETLRPFGKTDCGTNFPLLRYADVLLMLAEAENEVNGPTALALECLNLVKARAGLTAFSTASKETLRQEIRDERYRELTWECLRTQDLKRWGILIQTMKDVANEVSVGNGAIPAAPAAQKPAAIMAGTNITARDVYWPIPTRELSLDKLLVQNTGW